MQSILAFLFPPPPTFERLIEEMTEPSLSAPKGETIRGTRQVIQSRAHGNGLMDPS
jgi:hypothetical protein